MKNLLSNCIQCIEKNFGLVIASGLFFGLLLGHYFTFSTETFTSALNILMVFLMFFSALKVDLISFFKNFNSPFWPIVLVILKLIFLPILAFFLGSMFFPEYKVGFLLLAASPAAMSGPGVVSLFNKVIKKEDIKTTLIVSVLSNLLIPFVLPLILFNTVGVNLSLPMDSIFYFLGALVFLPFFAVFTLQKYQKKVVKKLEGYAGLMITLICFFFFIASVAPYADVILNNIGESIYIIAIVFLLSAFFHFFAYLISFRAGKSAIITAIIIMAYSNTGIMIVLAANYFDRTTLLTTIYYEFAWAIGLLLMQLFFSPKKKARLL